MLGITAIDNYWTGIYNSETVVFQATGLPTEWDNSLLSSHIDGLPDNITDYLVLSAQWAGTTESWEPEVSKGSYGFGVKYTGYQSSIRLHNKETQPVIVNVSFDSQISGASGWTLPLTGLRAGDSISPTPWTGSTQVTIPKNGYVVVKITSATVNISGCMDSTADNYNPDATQSDGSCEYRGCTDPNSLNYDQNANVDDGSCIEIVNGCTCSSADNYDSGANRDDGSCVYPTSTDYELPVEFVPPSLVDTIRAKAPWMVKCDTGWFVSTSGKQTNKFNYNTSSTTGDTVSLGNNYSGEPIELRIRPMPGYTITGTYNGTAWQATFDSPYRSSSFPDGTYGGDNSAIWVLTNITGPTETPESPPAEIIDVNPEINEEESEVPTQNQENQTTTQVVTQSHSVSEVAEETAQSPWLFLILGVTTLGAGVYYFTRG